MKNKKMQFRAILGINDKPLKFNHGDGKGLVSIPFDDLEIEDGKRTALYRHFDAKGNLLYIGISASAMARMCQHKQAAYKWTDDIATMTVEWLDSRYSALRAERDAIIAEKPMYNINHNAN